MNFNNFHDEVPHDVSNLIMDTFYETSVVCPEYVIGNHFTDNSEMSLAEYGLFFTFREGKSIQSDIEKFMSDFKMSETGIELDRNIFKAEKCLLNQNIFKV